MSLHRISPDAGFARRLPKGPNGRSLCRRCNVEVPKYRRTFCSDECVHQWKIRTQPQYVRQQLLKRDAGVCAGCGLDCGTLERAMNKTGRWHDWNRRKPDHGVNAWLREQLGLPPRGTIWHADHQIPVAEGGGECGLDGYRTLCRACHAVVTRELRERLKRSVKAG